MKCQINKVSPVSCQRVAKVVRVTKRGFKVCLCTKCDKNYGDVVGKVQEGGLK